MALSPGTRLGPYEIVSPLGAGGMGEVYRALDTRLGREVAVKVLPPHLHDNPDLRTRFEREARAVSSLNHPHICTLHDIGREGETDYLVMELVEGETLADRLEKGALPAEQLLKLGIEIADALDRAHRAGIVHRDLKPGNIMLSRTGAKLMDFGLARATGPEAAPGSGVSISGLTQSPTIAKPLTVQGSLVGTFQYMAPEQLEGVEADVRSDIWALGCVLYEMATGKPAFYGGTQASLISTIMKDQPRPIADFQALSPPGLERLVRSCLVKDPEERIQTAHDVGLHLRWISEGGSQAGVPAPVAARRRSRERLAWGLALGAGVAAVVLAVLHFAFPPPPLQTLRFEVSTPPGIRSQDTPKISPDGRIIAFSAVDTTGTSRVWIRPLDALTAQVLPGTEGSWRPFWSPDSRYLAFMAGGKLKRISIAGGPPTVICDAPTGYDGTWGRKGVILFDGRSNDPIMRVSAEGGVATVAVGPDTTWKVHEVGWPEFLPDGEHFLYLSIVPQRTLRVAALNSKTQQNLGPCESQAQFVRPGYLLFSRGGSLVLQRFDPGALKFVGDARPVAEQVGASTGGAGKSDFRASANGVLVYSTTPTESGELVQYDRSGKKIKVIPFPPDALIPSLSPDERQIAMRVIDPEMHTRDIWVVDRARELATRLTFEKSDENAPLWAPDGRRIAYLSTSDSASAIYIKQLSGSGETELLAKVSNGTFPMDWSMDGSTIFLAEESGESSDIWVLPTTGDRKPRVFLNGPFNESEPHLSPDGKFLAYTSDESGRKEVYVQSYPDRAGKWRISTHGGSDPRWGSVGQEVLYLSAEGAMVSVPVRKGAGAFEPGAATNLFTTSALLPSILRAHYAVTADGKTFFIYVRTSSHGLPTTTVVVNWLNGLVGK